MYLPRRSYTESRKKKEKVDWWGRLGRVQQMVHDKRCKQTHTIVACLMRIFQFTDVVRSISSLKADVASNKCLWWFIHLYIGLAQMEFSSSMDGIWDTLFKVVDFDYKVVVKNPTWPVPIFWINQCCPKTWKEYVNMYFMQRELID